MCRLCRPFLYLGIMIALETKTKNVGVLWKVNKNGECVVKKKGIGVLSAESFLVAARQLQSCFLALLTLFALLDRFVRLEFGEEDAGVCDGEGDGCDADHPIAQCQ